MHMLQAEKDFKYRGLFWVTSRQAPSQLWLQTFVESDEEVDAFMARDIGGHPAAWTMENADIINVWQHAFAAGVHEAATRGSKTEAGIAFPSRESAELLDTWRFWREHSTWAHFVADGTWVMALS